MLGDCLLNGLQNLLLCVTFFRLTPYQSVGYIVSDIFIQETLYGGKR